MPTRPGQVFHKSPCSVCGRMISINGMARASHERMHQRRKAEAITQAAPTRDWERCSCGGQLVADVLEPGMVPLTSTCAGCGKVFDEIPF